jgi:hypothetical protein
MQANGPLPERIVRKLEDAIDRLNDDFEQVEFWAAALSAFLQPVPGYEPPDNEFLLPPAKLRREGSGKPRRGSSAHS